MIPGERSPVDGWTGPHARKNQTPHKLGPPPPPQSSASDANPSLLRLLEQAASKEPGAGWNFVNVLSKTSGDGKIDIFLRSPDPEGVHLPLWNLLVYWVSEIIRATCKDWKL